MKHLLLALLLLATPAQAQNTFFAGTPGDMIYRGSSGWQPVPSGNAGQLLMSNGAAAAPTWTYGWGTYTTTPLVLPAIATNKALMNVTGGNAAPTAGTASQFLDTIGYDVIRPPATGSMLYKDGTTGTWQSTTGQPNVSYVMTMQSNGVPAWMSGPSSALIGLCSTSGAFPIYNATTAAWVCSTVGGTGSVANLTGQMAVTNATAGATAFSVAGVAGTLSIDASGAGSNFIDGASTFFRTFAGANYLVAGGSAGNSTLTVYGTASGNSNSVVGAIGGLSRWNLQIGDGVAESGANAGSNFNIIRYADAGSLLGTPLSIIRSTGQVQLAANIASTSDTTGTLVVTGGIAATGRANFGDLIAAGVGNPGSTAGLGVANRTTGLLRWQWYSATGDFQLFNYTLTADALSVAAATSVVTLSANVASTTSTTGTLVVTGGLGVSGALFAGTTLNAGTAINATTSVAAGTFVSATTTMSAGTSVSSPLHIGGSGTTGTQFTLQTTSGNGTTDAFAFKGGNNGATSFGTWSAATLAAGAAITSGTTITAGTGLTVTTGDATVTAGNLVMGTNTKTLVLKQGANGTAGTFICTSGGTITITNSNIAITDAIIISLNTVGGSISTNPTVNAITGTTSFTAKCATSDTSTYNYAIIKNAA